LQSMTNECRSGDARSPAPSLLAVCPRINDVNQLSSLAHGPSCFKSLPRPQHAHLRRFFSHRLIRADGRALRSTASPKASEWALAQRQALYFGALQGQAQCEELCLSDPAGHDACTPASPAALRLPALSSDSSNDAHAAMACRRDLARQRDPRRPPLSGRKALTRIRNRRPPPRRIMPRLGRLLLGVDAHLSMSSPFNSRTTIAIVGTLPLIRTIVCSLSIVTWDIILLPTVNAGHRTLNRVMHSKVSL